MRTILDGRPWFQLASHFFRKLFDFGLLSEAGADAYRRILIALIAVILSVGLLATRMYLSKYVALSQRYYDWGSGYQSNRGPYQVAILGDGALALAFPMLIVAFVVVLVSTSLFPDDLDYRVLRPLGVPKRLIFVSKALAASLFTGIFAVAASAAMTPLVLLMWNSRWADEALLTRLGAHGAASLSASVVTALVITATAGVLLVCVPRSRLRVVLIVFRSVGLFCVVLVIPLVSRLATIGSHIAAESKWMYLVPPVWFVGVEQLALGHATPFFLRLAGIAAAVATVAVVVLAGSYIRIYRRFETAVWGPSPGNALTRRARFLRRRRPTITAVAPFIRTTLARSSLHQGVLVSVGACGAALVLNGFLQQSDTRGLSHPSDLLVGTVMWAPFALVFAMNVAGRAALVTPIELRANWIFRVTEDEATRAEELNAVARTLVAWGVVVPLAVLLPLACTVLRWRALPCTSIAALGGLLLVELQMMEWRWIPFTCSYEPSTQMAGKTLLAGGAAYVAFTTLGPRLAWYGCVHPAAWVIVLLVLGALLLYLRRQRLWLSQRAALMFEELVPNEIEPLKLSEY